MARIIWGIIFAIIGIVITLYSETLYRWFGNVPIAEKYISAFGGSRLFYQLLGVFITFVGFMMVTNLLGPLLTGTLGRFFGG